MAMQGVYKTGGSASLSALPAGYLQAATAPGKHIAKGIEKWGAEIGGAIEEYGKVQKESDFVDQEFTDLQKYLNDLTDPGGAAPGDWGAQAQGAVNNADLAKDIATYKQGSLSQRKAKVMDLKFRISQFYKDRAFGMEQEKLGLSREAGQRAETAETRAQTAQELREKMFNEAKRATARTEEHRQDTFHLRENELLNEERAAELQRQQQKQNMDAFRTATGALPLESGYAPGSREATMFPIKEGQRMAATPEMMATIHGLMPDAAETTMGQNVAAARQMFAGANVPALPGLRPDNLLTDALAKFGKDKDSVEQITAEFDRRFGPAEESRIGKVSVIDYPEGKQYAVWTSEGQLQLIYKQDDEGGGVSTELQSLLGGALEGDLMGDDKTMRTAMEKIGKVGDQALRGKMLTEYLDLRKKTLAALHPRKAPGLDSADTAKLKTLDQSLENRKRALNAVDAANTAEITRLNGEIIRMTREREKIYEDHVKRWQSTQGTQPSSGTGSSAPTRVYNPSTGLFEPRP
jgi:hypothetical protein